MSLASDRVHHAGAITPKTAPHRAGSGDEGRRGPASVAKLVLLALLAIFGMTLLTGLGVWQLERRVWKLDLIERVDRRVHAAPVAAPGPAEWPSVSADRNEYTHVKLDGHFVDGRDTLVQAMTELGGGYWVLTPFVTTQGFTVLVNRGFVPADRSAAIKRAAPRGATEVTGLLRISEPKGRIFRGNDPSQDRWYSRDVAAIAAKRGLADVAPYFIDEDATPDASAYPRGGLTVVHFPNNHLVYALTWFALALMLAGAGVVFAREEWRARKRF